MRRRSKHLGGGAEEGDRAMGFRIIFWFAAFKIGMIMAYFHIVGISAFCIERSQILVR